MRWFLLVALAACGRIGFDARTDATATADAYTGCPVIAAAAGRQHTCAVDERGRVWCFGLNDKGQVQAGGPISVIAPVEVALPMPAVEITAGRDFSCARLGDGGVSCWGQGAQGQRGDGTMASGGPSTVMLGAERAVAIAAGAAAACIIRESDRAVMCWGDGAYYAAGQPTATVEPVPVLVANTTGTRTLALGHRHGCLIDATGQPRCWGRNDRAQLSTTDGVNHPTPQLVAVAPAVDIAASGQGGCAVEQTGDVRCWGANDYAQLGLGDFNRRTGVAPATLQGAARVATFSFGACAALADGAMECWGTAAPGPALLLAPARAQIDRVTDVIAGYYHMCAIYGGAVGCWGACAQGQCGRGAAVATEAPRAVLDNISAVTVGDYHACAIRSGDLHCWGANEFGQIGDGSLTEAWSPVRVMTGLSALEGVTTRMKHTCAWGGGRVTCWGENSRGSVGVPATTSRRVQQPILVSGLSSVSFVGAGGGHTCALDAGEVKCWGDNGFGQLGDGTRTTSSTPRVVPVVNPSALAVGGSHTCALAGGAVKCWGENSSGQLGDGTTTDRLSPVDVTLPAQAMRIETANHASCAILINGELHCWGLNVWGGLGVGDTTNRLTPTRVALPDAVVDVSPATFTTCARLANSDVYCWGDGLLLGNAPDNYSTIPIRMPTLTGAEDIHASEGGACAVLGGVVSCWGSFDIAADAEQLAQINAPAPAAIPPCD